MQTGWAAKRPCKGLLIERVPCRDYGTVDLAAPPKGILHTTEGSFESALAEFKVRYAPTFLVGRDKRGKVRIVQLQELSREAGALEHPAGTPETNKVCRVQIEIAGYSQRVSWLPDNGVTGALARLLAYLETAAGIPLEHPRVNRDQARWEKASGWLGHADVPNNTHWDPGALKWTALLNEAKTYREKPKAWPVPVPHWFWGWAQWRRAGAPTRPKDAPKRIPDWAWRRLKAMAPKK